MKHVQRHRPTQEDDSNPLHDATWLYSYADLMTQILIFSILMVSVLGVKEIKPDQGSKPDLAQAVADVESFIKTTKTQNDISIDRNADRLVIRMKSAILFREGQAVLTPQAESVLAGLAPVLARAPSPLRVEGHTDNVPIRSAQFPSNWELSTARAISVVDKLEEHGIDARRLSVAGYGEFHPIAANDTPDDRALNRRVEIVLVGG